MRAFIVSGLVFSIRSQEIGFGERLRNDLLWCRVRCKTLLTHSLSRHASDTSAWIKFSFCWLAGWWQNWGF